MILNGWKLFIHPLFDQQFPRLSSKAGLGQHRAVMDIAGPQALEGSLSRRVRGLVLDGAGMHSIECCSPSGLFARDLRGLRRLSHGSRTMNWNVRSVDSVSPLALAVRFEDRRVGNLRFEASHFSSLCEALQDREVFQSAAVKSGGLTWPGEPDLPPDAICRKFNRPGEWRLR
jgi:hypothetical protein